MKPTSGVSRLLWVIAMLVGATLASAARGASETAPAPGGEATTVEQTEYICTGASEVLIRSAALADATGACEGAKRALRFLAVAGLGPPPGTTIEIVKELPGDLLGRAVGCYLRQSKSVLLLAYDAFQAGGQWFRVPVDRDLYTAAAAHEMAHAVVGCHSEPKRLPVAAHEYVAYVVMFATMDPQLRRRVLAKFPGTGFSSTLQINDINHIVNPNQFGADAWRHYLRRRDRAAWLREIASGRIVQELPSEGP